MSEEVEKVVSLITTRRLVRDEIPIRRVLEFRVNGQLLKLMANRHTTYRQEQSRLQRLCERMWGAGQLVQSEDHPHEFNYLPQGYREAAVLHFRSTIDTDILF